MHCELSPVNDPGHYRYSYVACLCKAFRPINLLKAIYYFPPYLIHTKYQNMNDNSHVNENLCVDIQLSGHLQNVNQAMCFRERRHLTQIKGERRLKEKKWGGGGSFNDRKVCSLIFWVNWLLIKYQEALTSYYRGLASLLTSKGQQTMGHCFKLMVHVTYFLDFVVILFVPDFNSTSIHQFYDDKQPIPWKVWRNTLRALYSKNACVLPCAHWKRLFPSGHVLAPTDCDLS